MCALPLCVSYLVALNFCTGVSVFVAFLLSTWHKHVSKIEE